MLSWSSSRLLDWLHKITAISLSKTEEVWESWLGDRASAYKGDWTGLGGEQLVFVSSPFAGEGLGEPVLRCPVSGGLGIFL